MVRRFVARTGGLALALTVGLAVVGLFGVVSGLAVARDWPGRPAPALAVYLMQAPTETIEADGTYRFDLPNGFASTYVFMPVDPVRPSWDAIAGVAGAVVIFGLLVAIGVTAARRGLYAAGSRRLLGLTGVLAVGAGLAAFVVTAIRQSPQWSDTSPFLVWVLIGCALLAVREVLARAGALRSELDGVI